MSRRFPIVLALAFGVWLVRAVPVVAQFPPPPPDQPDLTMDAGARAELVEAVIRLMNQHYVFPEKAKEFEADLRGRLASNDFQSLHAAKALCRAINDRLQAVCHDKHLRLLYSHETLPAFGQDDKPTPETLAQQKAEMAFHNYGFQKVERLDGNVGYLELRRFCPTRLGGDTAVAAMTFLSDTDALIVDLRRNGGGEPEMIALLSTYLFPADAEPVHLNDIYTRTDNSTHQWWTLPYVRGKRYAGKPVYVLTSRFTGSGAEEFANNLKVLKRATIVGETTAGAANPGDFHRINDHWLMFVADGRAINPVTKTNWEGVGVAPDVKVPADKALANAHAAALEKLLADQAGPANDPLRARRAQVIRRALDRLRSESTKKPNEPAGRG
jgi:hypothetical protein